MQVHVKAREQTEAFSQVILLFSVLSDLELTSNQLARSARTSLCPLPQLWDYKHAFFLVLKIELRSLCFKASTLQTELSSQFWILLF